jgi:hypothetical protein
VNSLSFNNRDKQKERALEFSRALLIPKFNSN